MFSRWPIRDKTLVGMALLIAMIGTLCFSGLYGLYAYGDFVDSLRYVEEFRLATAVEQSAERLRVDMASWRATRPGQELLHRFTPQLSFEKLPILRQRVVDVRTAIRDYRAHQELARRKFNAQLFGGSLRENEALWNVEQSLDWLDERLDKIPYEIDQPAYLEEMKERCRLLHAKADEVPGMLQADMMAVVDKVRERYRTLIRLAWTALISTALGVALITRLVSKSILRPIRELANGSRRIASGDYRHHVEVGGSDEFSELAKALNEMTDRFLLIRDDLDRQVRQRTAQIVRGERLAGVGFLAAGVSHEINNPLASIAMCAESLESRLAESEGSRMIDEEGRAVVTRYLAMIRSEAERCEQISQKLFEMSQIGNPRREVTDLRQLVQEVADVLRPLKQARDRDINIKECDQPAMAPVDAGEIKQVIMNLLTNALEHVEPGGKVSLTIKPTPRNIEIVIRDDGAGMTQEVKEHLFEPFFTRRANGGGTGLGLSVAHRIVSAHEGKIIPDSDGPGLGSVFRVSLPRSRSPYPGVFRDRKVA
ncbi:MAG: HAMP domain-containing histidine kinase [Pirellulales bacterium]|nr:HAMP domain-containing histidine kinase [Pirellulales bacterium]